MPVYKISKADRCKLFNITPELYDSAQRLIAEHDNEVENDRARGFLSWYDACRAINPTQDFGKWHFFLDCASGDHGSHLTITLSDKAAAMLRRELSIELEYVHKVHHRPQDCQE